MASAEIANLRKVSITPGSLAEFFEIGPVIGKGGFATVREGCSKKDRKKVALKILNPKNFLRDLPTARAIFNEIQVLKKVNHIVNPNLMKFLGAYEDMMVATGLPRLTIVTQICSGGELFDEIVSRGHYSEEDAAEVVRKLVTGLQDLHKHGILHRDIKPENILLESKAPCAEPIIADYGLAKVVGTTEVHSSLVGTPGYLAPEIIKSRSYTTAGDVWSAGVIAYILLCGYPPFYGETTKALYAEICAGRYEFHEDAWGHISAPAKDLVKRMLTVDPAKRATTADVLAHLFVTKQRTGAKNLNITVQNMRKFNAKRKLKAAALAAVVSARVAPSLKELHSGLHGVTVTADALRTLSRAFHQASLRHSTVDLAQFRSLLAGVGMSESSGFPVEKAFEMFDSDGNGSLDFQGLLAGLARLSVSNDEAIKLCFELFDADCSGFITRDELFPFVRAIGVAGKAYSLDSMGSVGGAGAADGPAEAHGDSPLLTRHEDFAAAELLESLFERMDSNRDGRISLDEFLAAVKADPHLAVAILGRG